MERGQPKVRFVAAITSHCLSIRDAGNCSLHILAGSLANLPDERFDDLKDLLLLRKRHFEINLGEFGLTIRTKVLVPEAAHNLEIAFISAQHRQLLEKLRRLGQHIKVTRLYAAGNEVVASAFRRRSRHERSFDLEKS